ncbi:beta family protein [Rhizobium sp. TRM96647]|uniref:beta family protein n=1 Tax=unclassified Rhizobium TaxID=2613769 RepID=UPI0021E828B7|nr:MULTISPECIES: beta family protein [unclassified Rhizobium]MCV3737713.1 beta family protein [Rhizobium sp. TRM96647]MCV3759557.1 beta family protein [Rhizobium sp. TRM96650]
MTSYMPILSIRPAEVVALAELPDLSKDRMQPFILIKPWLGSGALSRGVDKILHGFTRRRWFAGLDPEYEASGSGQSGAEIQALRSATNGFENWVAFVRELPEAIPVLQVRAGLSPDDILLQVDQAAALMRGIGVRIVRPALAVAPLIEVLARRPDVPITVLMDYGQQDSRLLVNVSAAANEVTYIRQRLPLSRVALSSTTFPSEFGSSTSQEIYERSFFNAVNAQVADIVYSDRGSARATEQGGGGVPRPRIDLPTQVRWNFFRSDCIREEDEDDDQFRARRVEAYGQMADEAVDSPDWDDKLNVWGTQLIKITQLRSSFGITSPAKATACRINIHMTKQSLYGAEVSSEELEEEWVD